MFAGLIEHGFAYCEAAWVILEGQLEVRKRRRHVSDQGILLIGLERFVPVRGDALVMIVKRLICELADAVHAWEVPVKRFGGIKSRGRRSELPDRRNRFPSRLDVFSVIIIHHRLPICCITHRIQRLSVPA